MVKKIKIKILPVMLVLAILSVAASAYSIYNMLEKSNNPLLTNQPDVQLTNFVGMSEEQAIKDESFRYEFEYVFDDETIFWKTASTPMSSSPYPVKKLIWQKN